MPELFLARRKHHQSASILQGCLRFLIFLPLFLASSPLWAQTVVELSPLNFPTTESGLPVVVTVDPLSANAAVFSITGTPNALVGFSILPTRNAALASGNRKIRFDAFLFGGSVVDLGGGTASGVLDATGTLNNVRVGATITTPNNAGIGIYTTTLTLRVIYQ